MASLLNMSSGSLPKVFYSNLRFDVLTNGTVGWYFYNNTTHEPSDSSRGSAIEYKKNGGSWTSMPTGTSLQVLQGDKLEFRGSSSAYGIRGSGNSWESYHGFASTANVDIGGHICSLIGGGNTISADYTFYRLFNHTAVVSAQHLILADNVTQRCYENLFCECTTLVIPPTLPAMTLADYCYFNMFRDCTGLETAPELPATTLVSYCYGYMFNNCTSLTTAPELPATTLVRNCYRSMFNGCSSLNYIKVKCTTKPSSTYSNSWLVGVATSGTFVKTGSWGVTRSTSCVPSNWTVQTVSS